MTNFDAKGIKTFKSKMRLQKYNPYFAFNIPGFKKHVWHFTRMMKRHSFVDAHHRLVKEVGLDTASEVEMFCQLSNITYRPSCGRVFLTSDYLKRMP